jgi:hypothetical protein
MLRRFFWAALVSIPLIGEIHGQEVIVAREKKPEVSTEASTPPEQPTSESPTPTRRRSRSREKESPPAQLTLEEMKAAGARAAGGVNDASASQSSKTREADTPGAMMPNPTIAPTPRSVKREPPAEQRNPSHSLRSRGTAIEGMGPIRPTLMESGREGPTPSPAGR